MVAANLGLRFLLELAALAAVGWWGWHIGGSTLGRLVLAIVLPLGVALVWGAFIAPKARVKVSRPVWYGLQVLISIGNGLLSGGRHLTALVMSTPGSFNPSARAVDAGALARPSSCSVL